MIDKRSIQTVSPTQSFHWFWFDLTFPFFYSACLIPLETLILINVLIDQTRTVKKMEIQVNNITNMVVDINSNNTIILSMISFAKYLLK